MVSAQASFLHLHLILISLLILLLLLLLILHLLLLFTPYPARNFAPPPSPPRTPLGLLLLDVDRIQDGTGRNKDVTDRTGHVTF